MNASTFSTNTANSHTAYDGIRMRAGITSAARRALAIAKTTTVRMPERWSRSASIQTANVPQNWTTTAMATSCIRAVSGMITRDSTNPSTTLPTVTTRSSGIDARRRQRARERHADGEAVDQERARIVEEALALEDHEQSMRRTELLEHGGRGRRVRGCDDRAERDRDSPGHVGHEQAGHDRDDDDGQRDGADGEAGDRPPVRSEVARRRIERGVQQHGRDEEGERELGVQDERRRARNERQACAGERHHRRVGSPDASGQRGEARTGEQQRDDDLEDVHAG